MALEPSAPGGGGFPQNGTIDWGQLASRTISFTIDTLSRLSAAQVDSYTFEVGRMIGSTFEISKAGRDKVIDGLQDLVSYGALGDVMWFGFGARHVVRAMPNTSEGLTCLALCGVLSEYYDESVSPEIFTELVKNLNAPPESTPSVLQWKALIRACAGSLSRTTFGTVIEDVMQLDPYPWHTTVTVHGNIPTRGGIATPKSVADALQGIGNISKGGELKSITIIGGNDASWLAAVSIWLFELRVRIYDEADRELYSNCGLQDPQVKVIYAQDRNFERATPMAQQQHSQQLRCVGRTFILQDVRDLVHMRFMHDGCVSGRAPWHSLLRTVFGPDFNFLMTNSSTVFGTAIGSAARLLRGIVHAEDDVPRILISSWQTYVSGSYGRGFLQNALEWLPELEPLRSSMETANKASFLDAKIRYEQQIALLKLACGCQICEPTKPRDTTDAFCHVLLIETVISLGFALSEMIVEKDLFPKRAGVEAMYRRQLAKRDHTEREHVFLRGALTDELGPFAYVYRDAANPAEATAYENCIQLFTGYSTVDEPYVARSDHGICAYRCILADISDDLEAAWKIHVLPGIISWHGKPYDQVADAGGFDRLATELMLGSAHLYDKALVNVRESVRYLEVWFELAASESPMLEALKMTPGTLISYIAHARGWVSCNNYRCRKIAQLPEGNNVRTDVLGTDIQIIRSERLSRCASIVLANRLGYKCILKTNECFQCCIRTGLNGLQHYDSLEGLESDSVAAKRFIIVSS